MTIFYEQNLSFLSLLHTSDVSASAIATQEKSSVKREKRTRKRKKTENFVFLALVLRLRLCQKSSSVKRQNVSAIVSARYEPHCLCHLCSSAVKVLALAIAIALTSLV